MTACRKAPDLMSPGSLATARPMTGPFNRQPTLGEVCAGGSTTPFPLVSDVARTLGVLGPGQWRARAEII